MSEDTNEGKLKKLINQLPTEVTAIEAEYSGSGDSGSIDDVTFSGVDDKDIAVTDDLSKQIEDVLYYMLDEKHGGWELNDGSSGNIKIDVLTRKMSWNHNEYYTESNTTEEEFEV